MLSYMDACIYLKKSSERSDRYCRLSIGSCSIGMLCLLNYCKEIRPAQILIKMLLLALFIGTQIILCYRTPSTSTLSTSNFPRLLGRSRIAMRLSLL